MKRLLLLCACAGVAASAAAQEVSLEYRVKAAFLLNFTRFVQWPPSAFENGGTLTICVAGINPFGPALAETIAGETTDNRRLNARVVQQDLAGCHVLFVPRGVSGPIYLERVGTAPILTVGESPNFLAQGGSINFVLDAGRVRFEIDQEAAARSQLKVSARLLQLARVTAQRDIS